METGTIIDIIILAMVVIAIVAGAVRGLFKTIIAIVVTVAAIVGSVWLSGLLVEPVTEWVYPSVSDKLEQLVTEPSLHLNLGAILSNATEETINDFLETEIPEDFFTTGIPQDILKIANQFGFKEEDLRKPAEQALKSAQEVLRNYLEKQKTSQSMDPSAAQNAAEDAVAAAGKTFLRPVVRAALIIILFILISIILKIITGAINAAVKKTGGVRQINSFGGAVLSFAEIAVVIYLLCYLGVKYGLTTIYAEQISGSVLLQFILKLVPAV